jgi:hypothetical protein
MRPEYCPCDDDSTDPCPACGATVKGDDPVNGFCQARHQGPKPWRPVEFVLTDKRAGKIVS